MDNIKGFDGVRTENHRSWEVARIFAYSDENPKPPHIILLAVQDNMALADRILLGELAPILTAIRNRNKQKEFKKQGQVPVLMVSFLGPQSGRIFHAKILDDTVSIEQSCLFDFTTLMKDSWGIFMRIILSSYVSVENTSLLRYP